MATAKDVLSWEFLSGVINEVKSPLSFLKNTIFKQTKTLPVETVELSFLTGARKTAPFVKVDGEAIMVKGRDKTLVDVKGPNIRLKMPFTPSEVMFDRQPGTAIFPTKSQQLSAIESHIANDIEEMDFEIVNVEEWMCSQAIRGSISYSTDDEAAWQITYPKPAGNTFTVSNNWSAANATPATDVLTVKRLMQSAVNLSPSIGIGGEDASVAFMNDTTVQSLLDTTNYEAGNLTINEQYNEMGVIRLGRFAGIPHVEYSTQVEIDGVDTSLIRATYFEYVNTSPAAKNIMYYFPIPDMKAFRGRKFQAKRFAKSWETEDPSSIVFLTHTRPLPVPRRPGSVVSVKVTS